MVVVRIAKSKKPEVTNAPVLIGKIVEVRPVQELAVPVNHAREKGLTVLYLFLVDEDVRLWITERQLYVIFQQIISIEAVTEVGIERINVRLWSIDKGTEGRVILNLRGKFRKKEL